MFGLTNRGELDPTTEHELENHTSRLKNLWLTEHNEDGTHRELSAEAITRDIMDPARLGTGTANSSTFLRGDNTWQAISLSSVWPVGSVFISVVSTNPSTLLGFGTWVAFATGRTIVGIDAGQVEFDTVEETGGAKTHTLSITEIPSHNHGGATGTGSTGTGTTGTGTTGTGTTGDDSPDHTHGLTYQGINDPGPASWNVINIGGGGNTNTTGASARHQHSIPGLSVPSLSVPSLSIPALSISAQGGGGAHNNLQPYVVVYMWKRTA